MSAEPPRRVLVVKLADLGDVLLCEPALRSLRAGLPKARLDLLVPPSSAELVRLLDPQVGVVEFPKHLFDRPAGIWRRAALVRAVSLARGLRQSRYDMVVLLHHLTTPFGARKFRLLARVTGARRFVGLDNGRGGFLTERVLDRGFGVEHESAYMLAVARVAGGAAVAPAPHFPPAAVDPRLAPGERYAVIFPATGGYAPVRTWHAERFAAVAGWLDRRGIRPVVLGAVDAREAARTIAAGVPRAVDLTGRTTLAETAGVVSQATVVVGGDSFIGHLAAALDRPTVSVFGPSNADAWRPFGAVERGEEAGDYRRRVVRHPLPCEPCIYTGYGLGRPSGCPARTCLERVTPDSVIAAVQLALEAA